MSNLIDRQTALKWFEARLKNGVPMPAARSAFQAATEALKAQDSRDVINGIKELPSTEPEPRYTEEELRVFRHGISLSLLSKRSAQHWQYDEDTATEIEFLERLYEKVGADMRGEQDE